MVIWVDCKKLRLCLTIGPPIKQKVFIWNRFTNVVSIKYRLSHNYDALISLFKGRTFGRFRVRIIYEKNIIEITIMFLLAKCQCSNRNFLIMEVTVADIIKYKPLSSSNHLTTCAMLPLYNFWIKIWLTDREKNNNKKNIQHTWK